MVDRPINNQEVGLIAELARTGELFKRKRIDQRTLRTLDFARLGFRGRFPLGDGRYLDSNDRDKRGIPKEKRIR